MIAKTTCLVLISLPSKQKGVALLLTVTMLLTVLTLLTLTATSSTMIDSKLSSNILDKKRATLAADSASRYAWQDIKNNFDLTKFIENSAHAGYYDLRRGVTGTKKRSDWQAIRTPSSWDWSSTTKHQAMANKLELKTKPSYISSQANPMSLSIAPQYTLGVHSPIPRMGTEGFFCQPVTILGAAQGASQNTRVLVEFKAIPRKSCFKSMVK